MSVSRRQFIVLSSLAAGSFPLARLRAWQTAGAPASGFSTIRRHVGYFTGKGGTIGWMVNTNAVVVVDAQFPDTATTCLQGLEEKSSRGVDLLFNTHHHADHTNGNGVFRPRTKRIVAQARVPELQKSAAQAGQTPVTADATFDKVWEEDAGDERLSARHYGPAHTGGDSVIYFERAGVAHMGDLLFHEMHPFVDRPGGASIQNWIRTIEAVLKERPAETVYIAGHAKPGLPVTHGRKALERQREYFEAVLSQVRKGMKAGTSKEEITKLASLPGFEGYHTLPPRLTLASVLGVAFDELSAPGNRL